MYGMTGTVLRKKMWRCRGALDILLGVFVMTNANAFIARSGFALGVTNCQ